MANNPNPTPLQIDQGYATRSSYWRPSKLLPSGGGSKAPKVQSNPFSGNIINQLAHMWVPKGLIPKGWRPVGGPGGTPTKPADNAPAKKNPIQAGAQAAIGGSAVPVGGGVTSAGVGSTISGGGGGSSAAGGTNSLLKQAQALVDASLNPQVNALTRQMQAAQNQTNYNTNFLNNQQARTQGDLQALYDHLTSATQGETAHQQAANQAALGQTNDAYRALLSQEANNAQSAQQRTNEELQRMGIGAVGPAALAQSQADDKFLQGLAGTNQANANANANMSNNNFGQLMASQLVNENTAGTQAKTQSKLANDKAVADLQQSLTQALAGLQGQKTDLSNTRAAKVQQLYTTLYNTALTNELAQEKAGLGAQVDLAKVGAYNARTDATRSKYNDPNQIALIQSQIWKNLHPTKGTGTQKAPTKGMQAAVNWLAQNAQNPQATSQIMQAFNDLLHQGVSPTQNNYGGLVNSQLPSIASKYGLGGKQIGAVETMLRYLIGTQQ